MRILLSVLTLLALTFSFVTGSAALTMDNSLEDVDKIPVYNSEIEAKSIVLMEANAGSVLLAENETAAYSPASVTKIMTLLLVAEAIAEEKIKPTDTVTVSEEAASMGGSQVFLEEGETMSVEELIKCTVIASANDAAYALAEHVSGSESGFVKAMNAKAIELQMRSTNFENVTGLDDTTENHVTSALDIAIMSRELLKHEIILKYSSLWQDTIRNGEFTLTNTNRLVRFYDGCNGLKTGSTNEAGFCMSATAKRDGMQLIAVVMGAKTRDERNQLAKELLDYGFANYSLYKSDSEKIERVPVNSGKNNYVDIYSEPFAITVPIGKSTKIEKKYYIQQSIDAPIIAGSEIGKIEYLIDGEIIGESILYSKEDVEKISLWELYLKMISAIFNKSGY